MEVRLLIAIRVMLSYICYYYLLLFIIIRSGVYSSINFTSLSRAHRRQVRTIIEIRVSFLYLAWWGHALKNKQTNKLTVFGSDVLAYIG